MTTFAIATTAFLLSILGLVCGWATSRHYRRRAVQAAMAQVDAEKMLAQAKASQDELTRRHDEAVAAHLSIEATNDRSHNDIAQLRAQVIKLQQQIEEYRQHEAGMLRQFTQHHACSASAICVNLYALSNSATNEEAIQRAEILARSIPKTHNLRGHSFLAGAQRVLEQLLKEDGAKLPGSANVVELETKLLECYSALIPALESDAQLTHVQELLEYCLGHERLKREAIPHLLVPLLNLGTALTKDQQPVSEFTRKSVPTLVAHYEKALTNGGAAVQGAILNFSALRFGPLGRLDPDYATRIINAAFDVALSHLPQLGTLFKTMLLHVLLGEDATPPPRESLIKTKNHIEHAITLLVTASPEEQKWSWLIHSLLERALNNHSQIQPADTRTFWHGFILKAITSRTAESRLWDLKETLTLWHAQGPARTRAREEFAKDIAAFANAQGGVLVVGVTDSRQLKGIGEGKDLENRLQFAKEALSTHIAYPGDIVQFHQVEFDSKVCLVIIVSQARNVVGVRGEKGSFSYPVRLETGSQRSNPEDISQRKGGLSSDNTDFMVDLERFVNGS